MSYDGYMLDININTASNSVICAPGIAEKARRGSQVSQGDDIEALLHVYTIKYQLAALQG